MSKPDVPDVPDVIVVGAGHNGLVAAGYLARSGLRVQMVEAYEAIGGMTLSPAAVPEAPDHRLNLCAADIVLMRGTTVAADLELARYGYSEIVADPMFAYLHPDGESVAVFRDVARTVAGIERYSRRDALAYAELARTMDAGLDAALPLMLSNPARPAPAALARAVAGAAREGLRLPSFLKMLTGSGENAIAERFEHPVVRSLLFGVSTFTCPVEARGTGLYLILLGLSHRFGLARVRGGTGMLSRALAEHLTAHRGEIRTGAAVAALTLTGDRVTGVRLTSGEELTARLGVVTSCDPGRVLLDMLPPEHTGPLLRRGLATAPRNVYGAGPFKVDMALRGRLRLDRFRRDDGADLRIPSTFFGTEEEIAVGYREAVAGRVSERMPGYVIVPTALDPSQAPDGQDTVYLYSGATPVNPVTPWRDLADTAAKTLVSRAAEFYDGLEELEIGRHVESWQDLEARTGSGSMTQIDLTLLRQGPFRPALGAGGYRGPVKGLWLTGAGTHPGGTVSGIPGQLAARTVLRDCARGR
jgi:phytoene dehydrogenase-like protein